MVSLMMYGTRVSLIVGFSAALVAMVIGGAVGVLSGYFGGRIDTLLMRSPTTSSRSPTCR